MGRLQSMHSVFTCSTSAGHQMESRHSFPEHSPPTGMNLRKFLSFPGHWFLSVLYREQGDADSNQGCREAPSVSQVHRQDCTGVTAAF